MGKWQQAKRTAALLGLRGLTQLLNPLIARARKQAAGNEQERQPEGCKERTRWHLQALNGLTQLSDHLDALSCLVLLSHHALLQDLSQVLGACISLYCHLPECTLHSPQIGCQPTNCTGGRR